MDYGPFPGLSLYLFMTASISTTNRIRSVDYLRGVIMLIMAIDHVRDFFHVTAQTADPLNVDTTTPALFFTRWITHFCAPTFLFLSGVSIYLSSRNKSLAESSTFLIKRGLFIALFDVLIMSLIMSFNPHYNFVFITVLWAIGCSMILTGLVLKISSKLILPLGLLIFFGHDIMTGWLQGDPQAGNGLVRSLFTGIYFLPLDKTHTLAFLYSIVPWTGVMMLGYAVGPILNHTRKLLWLGIGLLVLFVVLRGINVYGDRPWVTHDSSLKNILAFLNTSKYPPSLQFLCMTLSGTCIFLALAKNPNNAFEKFASVYGRVPFFFFVLHFLLAHILCVIAFYATGHTNTEIADPNTGIWFRPREFGFSLPIMYAVWLFVVLVLYYPCKWFYDMKKKNPSAWLRYL